MRNNKGTGAELPAHAGLSLQPIRKPQQYEGGSGEPSPQSTTSSGSARSQRCQEDNRLPTLETPEQHQRRPSSSRSPDRSPVRALRTGARSPVRQGTRGAESRGWVDPAVPYGYRGGGSSKRRGWSRVGSGNGRETTTNNKGRADEGSAERAKATKFAGLMLMVDPGLSPSEGHLWEPAGGFRRGRLRTVNSKGTTNTGGRPRSRRLSSSGTPDESGREENPLSGPRSPSLRLSDELQSLLCEKTELFLPEPPTSPPPAVMSPHSQLVIDQTANAAGQQRPEEAEGFKAAGFKGKYRRSRSTPKATKGVADQFLGAPVVDAAAALSNRMSHHRPDSLYHFERSFLNCPWRSTTPNALPPEHSQTGDDFADPTVGDDAATCVEVRVASGRCSTEGDTTPHLPDIQSPGSKAKAKRGKPRGGESPQPVDASISPRPPSRSRWNSNVMQLIEESSVAGWSAGWEQEEEEGGAWVGDSGFDLLKLSANGTVSVR